MYSGSIIWLSIFGICAMVFFGIAAVISIRGISEIKDLVADPDLKAGQH